MNNPVTLLLLYTTFHLPFCIFLFRNSFEAIPGALRDAALIDGCHEFGVLPGMNPGETSHCHRLIYTLYLRNEFICDLPQRRATTVPVVLAQMANAHRFASQQNALMAGSVLAFLPILVLFLFFQRFFVQGLTSGATRG
jgi:multiple sugar transport system permease protein